MQISPYRIENLTKSKSDKNSYLFKQLSNNLKVLMISDSEADKSAASMNVNIGSLSDPEQYLGLAHFCEHMLFMGTEKYPKEDEYSEYLNQNSGSSNAFTDLDVTNYYFDVSNEAFEGAMDRFAQFFLKPIFISDVVEREMKAVDSENKKNLQNDSWRFLQLQRSNTNQNSIFNKFSTGNLETLNKPHIRDALLEFHGKLYSSDVMSLVLLSDKSIEELEKLVDSLFSNVPQIPNFHKPLYDGIPAYDQNNCGYFYNLTPVTDQDNLSLYWFLPDSSKFYKKKPLSFLSSLFGHEGPNTLTSALIKDDLISSLTAGSDVIAKTYSKFYITVKLTKKGLSSYQDVIDRILLYVHIIQNQPINKRFYDEISQINRMKFEFKNKETPIDYVSNLSYQFIQYTPEDILTGPYIFEEFDEHLIRSFLDELKISNLNIYLTSKSLEEKCDLTEKWYGTKYSHEKFSDEFVIKFKNLLSNKEQICQHNLDYPPENVFIPKSLELHPEDGEKIKYPEKILEEEGLVVWYKRDYTFNLPKAIAICQVYLNKSIKYHVEYETIAYLWNSIVENELKELSYMASEANVKLKFHVNNEGLYLQVSGFSTSLMNALTELVKMFKSLTAHDKHEKLKIQIQRHAQEMSNFYFKPPYAVAMAYLEHHLVDPHALPIDKLNYLQKGFNIDELVDFVTKFHQESRFEWIIQGNVKKEEALSMAKTVQEIIQDKKLSTDRSITFRTVSMNLMTDFYYTFDNANPNEQNSAIATFLQCGKLDEKQSCMLLVTESLLRDRFFNELRTRQALGYIAALFHREYRCNEGLVCIVQSAVKCPEYIWGKIKEFFDDSKKFIEELSDELFKTHLNSVIVDKKVKDLTLFEEIVRNAHEVKKRQFVFDRRDKQINILENMKKEEFVEFYMQQFVKNLRRLDVEFLASGHKEENEKLESENAKTCEEMGVKRVKTESIQDFKKRNTLYPDFFHI